MYITEHKGPVCTYTCIQRWKSALMHKVFFFLFYSELQNLYTLKLLSIQPSQRDEKKKSMVVRTKAGTLLRKHMN